MRILFAGLVIVMAAAPAFAQPLSPSLTTGGTNMPPDFYPRPKCEPAGKAPVQPGNNPDAMNTYNMKVRVFNQKVTALNICMKDYVDNAQNDINTIQKTVRDAVAEANAR
jgi:hypothetical protein